MAATTPARHHGRMTFEDPLNEVVPELLSMTRPYASTSR
jgi:hypothetical protein